MPSEEHLPRAGEASERHAECGCDRGGPCPATARSGKIRAGTDGRAQGTTAARQFGAEGVGDLRLLVQMVVLATPTELERLATERDGLVVWLARQFPDALTVEDAEDLVADALLVLAGDPRLPSGGRRRRNYLRRALQRDALDEL